MMSCDPAIIQTLSMSQVNSNTFLLWCPREYQLFIWGRAVNMVRNEIGGADLAFISERKETIYSNI